VHIGALRLVNFRSYSDAVVEFRPGLNVIVGRNASGKTNLLEGACFALRGASCRTNREEKAVRWGATFTRVEATLTAPAASDAGRHRVTSVAYAPGQGKQARVDGVDVETLDELRRQATVFVFVPESLLLVKGAPARRRAHLDAFASAFDRAYAAALRDFNESVRQRNAQLAAVRDGSPVAGLDPWDRQVVRCGLALSARRRALVDALATEFARYAARLAPDGGRFGLSLVTQLDTLEPGEDGFLAALDARRQVDIRRAVTGIGPHRDDLSFVEVTTAAPGASASASVSHDEAGRDAGGISRRGGKDSAGAPVTGRDLRLFGSQGEQRAAVLALLFAERDVAVAATGDVGTLLLDDVMSELDDARRRLLVELLTAGGQAIVTTTNRHYFTDEELAGAHVIALGPEAPEPELPGEPLEGCG
jgi:DNA replication and repair protein RecF